MANGTVPTEDVEVYPKKLSLAGVMKPKLSRNCVCWVWIAVMAMLGTASQARADLVINVAEVGSDVVFSYGGPGSGVDLTGLTATTTGLFGGDSGFINPSGTGGGFYSFGLLSGNLQRYSGTGPLLNNWGSGTLSSASSVSCGGSLLGIPHTQQLLYLSQGYTSLSDFPVSTMTFSGASFASLGITPTDVTLFDWGPAGGADAVYLAFSSSSTAVPEPTSLFGIFGVALAAFLRRKRRVLA